MKNSEAAKVLATAAGWDRRTIGEVDAQAWAQALDDLPLDECVTAVAAHFRICTDGRYLMPAHVREHVTWRRREDATRAHDQAVYDEIDARKAIADRTDADAKERSLAAMHAGRAHVDGVLTARKKAS